MKCPKSKPAGNLFHSSCCPALLTLNLLRILCKNKLGVLICKLNHLFLVALLRCDNTYLATLSCTEPLCYCIRILYLVLHHNNIRYKWSSGVILFHKFRNYVALRVTFGNLHMKMISSKKLALPDKEHLHNCVLTVTCTRNDISVINIICCNLLLLCNLLDTH